MSEQGAGKKPREFELRFNGLHGQPEVVAMNDGELKNPREVIHVIEKSYFEQLEKENAMLLAVLSDWINFENQQIKKEGPYVGAEINRLINNAKEVLSKLGGGGNG